MENGNDPTVSLFVEIGANENSDNIYEYEDSEYLSDIDQEDEGEDIELEEDGLGSGYEFITSPKGTIKFYAFGFGFNKKRSNEETTTWRCDHYETSCSDTASTIVLADGSHGVQRVGENHNHLLNINRKHKLVGRHRMKLEAVQNRAALPVVIAQKALVDNQLMGEYFGTSKALREVVNYTRSKKLNAWPVVLPNNRFFEIT